MGGGGSNAVNRMLQSELQGVDFWVLNTDQQAGGGWGGGWRAGGGAGLVPEATIAGSPRIPSLVLSLRGR